MVWGLEISVIYNHVLGSDQGNAGAPLQSGQHHVMLIVKIIYTAFLVWLISLFFAFLESL